MVWFGLARWKMKKIIWCSSSTNLEEKKNVATILSLVGGELVRALLIQIQKLKLDIDTAMLELDQILKANEINFAILAALPAFFLAFC
ncbi:hypothetical protein LOK49_Contig238G00005 [Camellia lanceoleosa]|nr:hypothetical protein LOK49_Contig238G00005 [Camellia lanceoleosa]